MGNWRERPRRNFRNQKPPWSAIRNYDHDPPLEHWRDGIPLWEKKFCKEIGCVPWGKIVDSKNFIYCHTNVVNWDDSACEEAFHNAKKRYWVEINGHQSDIYLPDPDKYIEQIDWSPDMDSEMIEELDWAYHTPNMKQHDVWLECRNKRTRNSSSVWTEGDNEDPGHVGNPWGDDNQFTENTGQGCSQWNLSDSGKVNNDGNPWDSSIDEGNRGTVDSAWKVKANQVATSWKNKEFASDASGMVDNAWRDRMHQGGTASWKTRGFASDARNNSWSRHQRGASNFDHYNRPGNNSYNRNVRHLTDRTRPNIHRNNQDWKYQYRYGKRPKDAEFDNFGR
ncbi:unnamed protein product [Citrullus colocynthis]|uniref:Uncharacterized protein n=1 Tax=Citrullus colocynthis TaxID=252529 RepID=A0ABP0XTG2_9ROSI